MKNAFVLQHHHGDDGNVVEGMILKDISEKRFAELENNKLVREATAKEVKDGYKPAFTLDDSDNDAALSALEAAVEAARREVANLAEVQIIDLLATHQAALESLRRELENQAAVDLQSANERAGAAESALAEAQKEIARMSTEEKKPVEGGEKKAGDPANKKAGEPAKKSA